MRAVTLEHRLLAASDAGDGAPVLILLHGRGSDMRDLQGLARVLPPSGVLVTPQAPHPGRPWGYGAGWAWYRYLGDDRPEGASLARSLAELRVFLDGIQEHLKFRPGPLVLGGFSQGATTSLAYAMAYPGMVDGIVVLSGFLANREELGAGPETLGDTPVFWAHGTQDPAVPHTLAVRGRRGIEAAGGRVTTHDYPIGHWVSPEEMSDLKVWLESAILGWG